jgi:diguanylate cyclase (GGDEF)-like protein
MSSLFDSLPHSPGSRYASELKREAGAMRFPPDLEKEYRRFYLAERRSHVRSFNVIMLAIAVCALLACLLSASTRAGAVQHFRVAAIAVAYLLLIWASYSRFYESVYLRTASLLSAFIGVVAAVEIAFWISAGVGELFAILAAYSIGLYFLAGILYRAAVQANLAMVVALAVTLAWLEVPAGKIAYLVAILAGTASITGIAFRHQGIRFRRAFLQRGLIAEMAARDGLTGLKNRRAFDEHLTRVWQQALRDRRPLVVMLSDVDEFKSFNDRNGHQAGDDALKQIAAAIDSFAQRPLDLAARYGGEELAVILFDMPRDTVATVAEQIRAAVQNLEIPRDEKRTAVTISIGVAIVRPTLERSPEGALQLADEALYAAKQNGRNCVVLFESEHEGLSTGVFRSPRGRSPARRRKQD